MIGVAGLLISALYARQVAGTDLAGLLVLILLGMNPFYWNFSRIAMTEVPAFAWAALSLLLIHRSWTSGTPNTAAALTVGLIAGFGMLIRGTLIGLALAPLAFVILPPAAGNRSTSSHLRAYAAYVAGFAACFSAWALRNSLIDKTGLGFDAIGQVRMLFATNPVDPALPLRSLAQILVDAAHNLAWNVIFHIPQQTIPGAWIPAIWSHLGFFEAPTALMLTIAVCLCALSGRTVLPVLLTILPAAVLCAVIVQGGGARYWTNVSFLLVVAASVRLAPWIERRSARLRKVFVAALLACAVPSLALYVFQHERAPYADDEYQALARLYEQVARDQREIPAALAPHPHAFRIVTGQRAPMFVPGRGIDPEITHVVARSEEWASSCLSGAPVLGVAPWVLVQLETRTHYSVLRRALQVPCAREPGKARP